MARYAERLRSADLRVTRPRIAVLHSVNLNPHADTETIIGAVRSCLPDVSRQAVYDILHALTAVRLLRRFQPPGSVARYETRVGDNHHHMVCRTCGAIADVDCAVGAAPCLSVSDTNGFDLDGAEVIYWGRCPSCVTADAMAKQEGGPADPVPDEPPRMGHSHPLLMETHSLPLPTPAPVEWVAVATTTANIPVNTPVKPVGVGTGGVGANSTSGALGDELSYFRAGPPGPGASSI